VAPKTVRWKREAHTAAKHQLLRGYLRAWLPIMANSAHPSVLIVDGFAGPGTYEEGEPGSPLVILDTFLSHTNRDSWGGTKFTFAFIEREHDRFEALETELAALKVPQNASVQAIEGEFHTEIGAVLDSIPKGYGLPPSFVFIDPFGWTGYGLQLSSRILGFPKCEVLIYVPLPWIARFVDQEDVRASLDNLFSDDSWLPARKLKDGHARVAFLHDLFLSKLEAQAGYARSFEISIGGRGWKGYHLFFGTRHPTGLSKMKYAMWKLDPLAGARFADSTTAGQLVLFEDAPDLEPLKRALEDRFGDKPFTIEEAEAFTLIDTPYHEEIHLKKGALKPLELAERLEGWNRQKARTYPPGTILRFRPR
jgi:three-Cys-motif partner protein